MNNVGDIYPKVLADKKIEDVGPLKLKTNEGWIYPKYMEQICPGLPDWTALTKPDCVQALSTPDTFPNGRLLDYPADWGSRATPDHQGQQPAADRPCRPAPKARWSPSSRAPTAAKKPLVMMFWAPHYALAEGDVGWVTMPPCKVQDNAHCITPPDVDKIVWSGFEQKWPAAYAFLKPFTVDATEQQKMMLARRQEGRGPRRRDQGMDRHASGGLEALGQGGAVLSLCRLVEPGAARRRAAIETARLGRTPSCA